ncbi:MAG: arginine decarboxylase [Burkholderiales bacterium]|jgi:arginine decarboxylase|nr:arginine decarboxylase [Burkholderiales bacterium]
MAQETPWNYKKSREFYCIDGWANGYFCINKEGQITVRHCRYLKDKSVPLVEIIDYAQKEHQLQTPLLLRFTDIVKNRVERITKAFDTIRKKIGYTAEYTLIYPIKVNQNCAVVESIVKSKPNNGLESGSKPELLAVLSLVKNNKTPIICNGYKDREYIKTALIARKIGRNITIVIEKMQEAHYVIELAKELDVIPLLGVRCRLALTLAGKWAHSGGEKSKFGLSTTQVLELIKLLRKNDMQESLHLIHCHQGSQIANVKDIEHYINELAQVYIGLCKLGINIKIIDVGGGLAVDYEGSRTRSFNSTNYSLSEYAETILSKVKELSLKHELPLPQIFSESGRAVTAHHAVFVTNIVEVESVVGEEVPDIGKTNDEDLVELDNMLESFDKLPINEIYSSSVLAIESLHNRFAAGNLSLEKRAVAEQLFSHIKLEIIKRLNPLHRSHRELYDNLDEDLAKKIIANFSVFQSLPDSWAISQLFPVMPLSKLNTEPRMRGVIEDITCDSDGKINNYMDYQGNEPSLKLPKFNPKDPYLLGVFLVGAYQEIMGNLHNLFGKVTTLDISLDGKGGFVIDKIHDGFTKRDSLEYVGYDVNMVQAIIKKSITGLKINKSKQNEMISHIKSVFDAHTYLTE